MNRALGLGLACCLLFMGCGGGGGSSPSSTTASPGAARLSATYNPSRSAIHLTWVSPGGNIDGYNIEASINSGAYARINPVLISGLVTSATLIFTSAPPELAVLAFRVDAVFNGISGPYSNVAELQVPVTPPDALSATYDTGTGTVRVSWTSSSRIADHDLLERAPCDAPSANPTGPWSSLPLPTPQAASFLDTSGSESQGYLYRVSSWAGTISSPVAGPTPPIVIPPKAPTSFAAQSLPGAVQLTWVNQSRTATQIQITRRVPDIPGTTIVLATLSPTATSYQDSGLSLGYYDYSLSIADGLSTIVTPDILAAPANPPGSPALAATILTTSQYASASALSSSGLWAFGTRSPFAVLSADWGTWLAWSPTSESFAPTEFLRLDAQSRPHVLYQDRTSSANLLTHAWFDGSAWTTEVVQSLPATGSLLTTAFGLDSTGTPQTLQDAGPGGTRAGLVYSHKVAGAWVQEPLDPSAGSGTFLGTPTLFLDASNTPHALVSSWSSTQAPIREYTRNADGTWTSQILPGTQTWTGFYYLEDGVWADANTAWVIYQSADPSIPSTDGFWVLRKVAGTWQPPVLLKSYPHPGPSLGTIALSPDGTRVAAVCNTTNGLFLYTSTPQGWVESLLPIPPNPLASPYLKVAFDGANHLHILTKPSVYTSTMVDLHE